MDKLFVGNADDIVSSRGNPWIMGRFIPENDLCSQSTIEVKWGRHLAGEKRDSWAADQGSTAVILLRGRIRITFQCPTERTEVLLEKEGDLVISGPGLQHLWEVIDESLVLTLRWTSILDQLSS